MKQIWILGATGRVGRGVDAALRASGITPVLVGRDAARVAEMANGARVVAAATVEAMMAAITEPAVVINTIGPFVKTALPAARALAPGSDYLDLSNELHAIVDVLGLADTAAANRSCLVPAAGFGVLATEAAMLKLCEGHPAPLRARVDAIPFIEGAGDKLGTALAASIVENIPLGGRAYRDGKRVRVGVVSNVEQVALPDGTTIAIGAAATGDLEAAHRASQAPFVVSGSSVAPTGVAARMFLPVVGALASFRAVRNFMTRRLANVTIPAPKHTRTSSFTRARAEWADGTVREQWLRFGDGMTFTVRTATEVARRLANGEGRPGAFTPGALFGWKLAIEMGGELAYGQP